MKTMVLTRPTRLAMDEAARLETAEAILVVKNRLPRAPSASLSQHCHPPMTVKVRDISCKQIEFSKH